jgi:hypothetical protein
MVGQFDTVWAATSTNDDYIRMEGMKRVVDNPTHRKEIVVGDMSKILTTREWNVGHEMGVNRQLFSEYNEFVQRLGEKAGGFHDMMREHRLRDRLDFSSLIREPLRELPQASKMQCMILCIASPLIVLQIVFTLRAVQYPTSIPLSLASLHLIRENAQSFSSSVFALLDETGNMAEQLASVRKLYEIENIPNKVIDGREPFPENQQTLNNGISVEFR